jgi:hypothetical protein
VPAATPHAPPAEGGAHVEAKGHEAGKGHDLAKDHAEEEKHKLEEEKHKNEEEQLETEIELLCQEALHHIAEGNAAVGAACDIGSVAFPPAAAILHPVAALKSLGAAGLSLRAEYKEKWLSLAIKHMTPEQVEEALVKLQSEITSIVGLRDAIEEMMSESQLAEMDLEKKGKGKKKQPDAQAQPAAEEDAGDAKKHSKHSPLAQAAGAVAKDEGGELGAEAGGTIGAKLAESLAGSIGEGAGKSLLESLGHMMHNVLPWVGTGLAANKVRTTGDKIKDLKRKLWVLQGLGKDMGAKTGKPVDLPK